MPTANLPRPVKGTRPSLRRPVWISITRRSIMMLVWGLVTSAVAAKYSIKSLFFRSRLGKQTGWFRGRGASSRHLCYPVRRASYRFNRCARTQTLCVCCAFAKTPGDRFSATWTGFLTAAASKVASNRSCLLCLQSKKDRPPAGAGALHMPGDRLPLPAPFLPNFVLTPNRCLVRQCPACWPMSRKDMD